MRYFQTMPATNYPYVCFACRRSFKRTVSARFIERPPVLVCPHCGHDAVCLSRKFKPPRRSEIAQWRKIQALVLGGCFFYSYADPYPEHLREVPAFLRLRRPHIEKSMKAFPVYYKAIIDAARAPI